METKDIKNYKYINSSYIEPYTQIDLLKDVLKDIQLKDDNSSFKELGICSVILKISSKKFGKYE